MNFSAASEERHTSDAYCIVCSTSLTLGSGLRPQHAVRAGSGTEFNTAIQRVEINIGSIAAGSPSLGITCLDGGALGRDLNLGPPIFAPPRLLYLLGSREMVRQLHDQIAAFDTIEVIADDTREIVGRSMPDLLDRLPPKRTGKAEATATGGSPRKP